MSKTKLFTFVSIVVLFSVSAFAVDGVVLINQASVMAVGGFPYQINNSGSYKLSGNLVVPPNTDGIDIKVDNVSIDLNGFSISCPSGACTTGGTGILSFNSSITVRNGAITGFTGITPEFIVEQCVLLLGNNELVDHLQVSNCETGIVISNGTVSGSVVSNNPGDGVLIEGDGLATGNTVTGNAFTGIEVFGNGSVTNNVIGHNGNGLLTGINGFVGYGNNTFGNNTTDVNTSVGAAVSMRNNACKAGVC